MKKITYSEAIKLATKESLKKYKDLIIFGQGLTSPWYVGNTMTDLNNFSKRIIDTPVSENAITSIALGCASVGTKSMMVHPRMDFMLYSADPIINQIAKWKEMFGLKKNINTTIRAIINRGGEQGAQHSQSLYNIFANIPGLTIVFPSNPQDARDMLISSINEDIPIIYIDDRSLYSETSYVKFNKVRKITNIKPKKLSRGKDITIVSFGYGLKLSKIVIKKLRLFNISSELFDLRVIKPLNLQTIFKSIIKTGFVCIVDYGWKDCSVGSEIISRVSQNIHPKFIKIKSLQINFPELSTSCGNFYEKKFYFDDNYIVNKIIKRINEN